MSYPSAGDLTRRITIQQRQTGQDTFGQQLAGWVDLLTCWAEITPLSGRELMAAQAMQAETTHEIVIRYRPGITAAMRVLYQGRIFEIKAPPIDESTLHRRLTLLCAEGLTQG